MTLVDRLALTGALLSCVALIATFVGVGAMHRDLRAAGTWVALGSVITSALLFLAAIWLEGGA